MYTNEELAAQVEQRIIEDEQAWRDLQAMIVARTREHVEALLDAELAARKMYLNKEMYELVVLLIMEGVE